MGHMRPWRQARPRPRCTFLRDRGDLLGDAESLLDPELQFGEHGSS